MNCLNNIKPEKGKALISEPFLNDLYFQRSVILLAEHNSEGSMGFVVNKMTNLFVNSYFEQLQSLPLIPVFLGGPVAPDHLFYIHSLGNQVPDSIEIADNLFLLGDFECIMYHLLGKQSNTNKIKFFTGYSGWSAGQLQSEIEHDTWLVSKPSSSSDMLSAEDESFWKRSVESVGGEYLKWLNYPKNPLLN
ncbi:MAG: YqgE/AlgH family protein [Tannerella sp.]|jgi:putative transcriptional regulator|nr:YqgE/AlgH family protein [Tannerella sp.]